MDTGEVSVQVPECPEASDKIEAQIRQAADELIRFVRRDSDTLPLRDFERSLWSRVAVLFRLCVALFLAARHRRLDLSGYEAEGWRVKKGFATRTIKTLCGAVTYGRAYLRRHGDGWFPLDALLGITADGFSWRVIDLVTRLATQRSFDDDGEVPPRSRALPGNALHGRLCRRFAEAEPRPAALTSCIRGPPAPTPQCRTQLARTQLPCERQRDMRRARGFTPEHPAHKARPLPWAGPNRRAEPGTSPRRPPPDRRSAA